MFESLQPLLSRLRKEEGNFTIEASLIFPLIFLVTLVFVFFSIYTYQKASLTFVAVQTAERAAFTWDNSHKNPVTGEVAVGQYDDLYWRTFDDSTSDIFNAVVSNPPTTLVIQDVQGAKGTGGGLVAKKLQQAINAMPPGMKGTITYTNKLSSREITIQLEKPLHIPGFASGFLKMNKVEATAKSVVAEPVEFTREVDMLLFYAVEAKSKVDPSIFKLYDSLKFISETLGYKIF